jgi:hypothetical protein
MACKDMNNPQSWGSSITYSRRYCLSSIVGIAPDEDDDGNKASAIQEKKTKDEKPKMIEKFQWTELNQLIDQCDADYQKNIWDFLASQNICSFAEMDEKTFIKLRKGCLSNVDSKIKVLHAVS